MEREVIPLMVDANFQREDTLPSEKAKAYKMKMEALAHQGKSSDEMSSAKKDRTVGRNFRQTSTKIHKTYGTNTRVKQIGG